MQIKSRKNSNKKQIKSRKNLNLEKNKKYFFICLKFSLWLLAGFMIMRGFMARYFTQDTDSALYFSLMNPNKNRASMDQEYNNSFFELIKLVNDGIAGESSLTNFGTTQPVPLYQSHLYVLPYLVNFINGPLLQNVYFPFFLMSSSYIFGLYVLFTYLREQPQITTKWLTFFFILVIISPVFFYSLNGQLYMDRLSFGPVIFVVIRILENKERKKKLLKIFIVTLAAYTISERVALSLGVSILVVSFKSRNFDVRSQLKLVLLGLLGILWYVSWAILLSKSFYSSSVDPKTLLSNFLSAMNGTRTINLTTFVIVLLPFLILSLSTLRGTFTLAFALIPNLLVTVGGAELTGFLTHYHSLYLPVMLSTSVFGLSKWAGRRFPNYKLATSTSGILLLVLSTLSISTAYKQEQVSFFKGLTISGGKIAEGFGIFTNERRLELKEIKDFVVQFPSYVGENSVVTPPGFMPALALQGVKNLTYFPIGLGVNRFVIVSYFSNDLGSPYVDAFGLIPPNLIREWAPIQQGILNAQYAEVFRSELGDRTYVVFELAD